MAHDERQHRTPPAGPDAPAGAVVPARKSIVQPQLSLASLLDLTDDDLDLPLPLGGGDWNGAPRDANAQRSMNGGLGALTGADLDRLTREAIDGSTVGALHTDDTSSQPADRAGVTVNVRVVDPAAWVVTGTVSDAPTAEVSMLPSRATGPATPLAIAAKPTKPARRRPDTPVANFEKTAVASSVLWPRRPTPAELGAGAPECARCRAPFIDGRCTACGHHTPVRARVRDQSLVQRCVSFFVHSPSRALRTIGTLLLAPGLLTSEYLAGHRRRYYSPFLVVTIAVVLFSAVSLLAGLRVRPDRVLFIGDDRTEQINSGIVGGTAVGSQVTDTSRDLVDLALRVVNMIPPLWLPLMMCVVIALIAALRITQRRDGPAEVVFTAHVTTVFVLWWALAVPMVLLASRWGFELSASLDGVKTVQYLDDGQIAGLSPAWHRLRARAISPLFHSLLLAVGMMPYSILAYRRGFDETWPRAVVAGIAVAAVPCILLVPFA